MKKISTYAVIANAILMLSIISCGDPKPQASMQAPPPTLPVVKVEKRDLVSYLNFPARIEGEVNSEVRPKVSGYIKKVHVTEGTTVKQGQLLFSLETNSLSEQANAAKAAVNAAQVEVNRLIPLVEKNIISAVQLETAKAQLAQAKANYQSVSANISYANVKSPVDGVVGSINYRKGALVSAQDPSPLTSVSSIKQVYAYFSMNEKDYIDFIAAAEGNTLKEKIKKFPKVKLQLVNGSTYPHEGVIETIAGDINKHTGTISFRAKFDNKEGLLRNGSSGVVLVPQLHKDATVIPVQSTFEQQGKHLVYVIEDNTLVPQTVEVITSANQLYAIQSGLSEGQTILAKGFNKVRSGAKITPKPISLDSIINSFNVIFK
ncbi:efflux RND transporter periplasmic adaptor subunit [Flavobacteriaceae bacterium F08102]|nr:efflux RND transporter periplasmic adaptor subunit [Flavobacteriaceae bacterium F08102]